MSAYYQIPLKHSSQKFCGMVTPFRGVRVYTRYAMGMPSSETALEELMCHVLGDLVLSGNVAKLTNYELCSRLLRTITSDFPLGRPITLPRTSDELWLVTCVQVVAKLYKGNSQQAPTVPHYSIHAANKTFLSYILQAR